MLHYASSLFFSADGTAVVSGSKNLGAVATCSITDLPPP